MSYRKTGIKVILFTILLWILAGYTPLSPYVVTALGVFGFGTGLFLIFFDSFNRFDD